MTHGKKLSKKERKQLVEVNNKFLEESIGSEVSQEKQESMDIIFTRDYEQSRQIVRRMIRTGR